MEIKDIISKVKVYGLEEGIIASGNPMSVELSDCCDENVLFWLKQHQFLSDFDNYQNQYGKDKGADKHHCAFCNSSNHIEFHTKTGKYYCSKCRHQIERYGEAFETSPRYVINNNGTVDIYIIGDCRKETKITISQIDLPLFFYDSWSVSTYCTNSKGEGLHRKILGLTADDKLVVDHIDGNPLNNTRQNLQICTFQDNSRKMKLKVNNTSGITGVCYSTQKQKWRATINNMGKSIHLGYFNDFNSAAVARLQSEATMFGAFAPQKHLFQQYNIEYDEVDNYVVYNEALPEALAHFRRAKKLAASGKGEGHDQFLTSAIVQFNLKFTVKAWTEEERYHFIDFVSSQSTMHRIVKFNLDKAYIEYVDPRIVAIMKEKVEDYLKLCSAVVQQDIETTTKIEEEKKLKYLQILYSNPCGFQLTARMTTNYRQLKTIYAQRKTHRLPEWRAFCKWIETLPHAKEFICGGKNVKKN